MKNYLILLLFASVCSFAQSNFNILDQNVTGIINSSEGSYLIVEKGFIRISNNDIYTEYYRQIYNDSTIINPNTELKDNFDFNIIPYLSPNLEQNRIDFDQPINLGLFLQSKGKNDYYLTPFAEEFVDSINIK